MGLAGQVFLSRADRDELRDIALLFDGDGNEGTAAWLRELAERKPDDGEHLDFVNVVDVKGREKPYVFGGRSLADRFESVVNHGCAPDDDHPAFLSESPVYVGAAAERLIASERGDVLKGMGYRPVADELRRGTLPSSLAALVEEGSKAATEILPLLQRWAEEDAREGGR